MAGDYSPKVTPAMIEAGALAFAGVGESASAEYLVEVVYIAMVHAAQREQPGIYREPPLSSAGRCRYGA